LMGSRQAGKSSLMFLLLDFLIQEKQIPLRQLFYFDLENLIFVEELNKIKNFERFVELLQTEGAVIDQRIFVFIDEIQYLDHPSSLLKYVYDHYKGIIKFIVSGSSTLEIKQKFTDRLTGRAHPFIINPLNFYEYAAFRQASPIVSFKKEFRFMSILENGAPKMAAGGVMLEEIARQFEQFVLFGGYPGVALKYERNDLQKEDLSALYSMYVRKDIKDIGNIDDTKGFNNMVGMLAHQIGSLVNESELSVSAGLSRPTVRKYLALLENTFVCSLLRPFFTNARLEYSKMPKVYFLDTGLRNAVVNNFTPLDRRVDMGHIIENVVYSELIKQIPNAWEAHFWRSERRAEVDFVIKSGETDFIPIEVKYQRFARPVIPSGLRAFIKRYSPSIAYVITKDFWGKERVEKTKIFFLPAFAV
ncbi:MAG: ATP-binding protein, partial [Candidatus Jacksonbacteria bacterium]|nr:ATP-binding protein [Candidatus Jacksonbacteria bacterium]